MFKKFDQKYLILISGSGGYIRLQALFDTPVIVIKLAVDLVEMDDAAARISEVCKALDAGISEYRAVRTERYNRQSRPGRPRTYSNSAPSEHAFVEVDEYCRLWTQSRSPESLLDARSLISQEQSKLDSSHIPHSRSDLYNRIETYSVSKWAQKPDCISALHCARFGWKLSDWDFLSCVSCKQILNMPPSAIKLNGDEWALKLKLDVENTGHLHTCPWTRLPSPLDLICIPHGSELKVYLKETLTGFLNVTNGIQIKEEYSRVMDTVDFSTLGKEVFPEKWPSEDESQRLKSLLFIATLGWKFRQDDAVLFCELCLRQVPATLYFCEVPEPIEKVNRFCPVENHWSWCPWKLAFVEETTKNMSPDKEQPSTLTADSCNSYVQYLRQKCDSDTIKFERSGTALLNSLVSLMDGFVTTRSTASLNQTSAENFANLDGCDRQEQSLGEETLNRTESTESPKRTSYEDMPPKKRIRRELFDSIVL